MRAIKNRERAKAGFTLIEMLVVTVIIAILLSLVSMAVFSAYEKARVTRIGVEINQLALAMTAFQAKHSIGFPPTNLVVTDPPSNNDPLLRYVQKLFPRYQSASTTLYADLTAEGINVTDFDPGYSLVFWLVGFSGDPASPFLNHGDRMGLGGVPPNLVAAQYDFDADRMRFGRYFPQIAGGVDDLYTFTDTDTDNVWDAGETFDGRNALLYFDASNWYGGNRPDTGTNAVLQYNPAGSALGFRPYRNGDNTEP
ncbi:MAG: type II secretion system protein, partial [Pirellulales bacterium]